jgi:predicted glycosyltransferase
LPAGEDGRKRKIWIDLDNTPHVPFFRPIIRELEKRGHTVVLTARDAFQTCELATRFGLIFQKVGRHPGKSKLFKVWGIAQRSLQLCPFLLREKPLLGVNHTSRSQTLLCNVMRIPTVMIMDYEHAQTPWLLRPRWEIVPSVLFGEDLHCKSRERIRTYEGIKEDVYAPEFRPDPRLRDELHLNGSAVVVTVRPPATEAHYHAPESDELFVEFMNRACATPGVKVVLLPRNKKQEANLRANWPQWFKDRKALVPESAVDGLNLVWHSDLVVSGGGTMNREAAALGVPVYSIFRGRMGAVDRRLEKEGRLKMIQRAEEVHSQIPLRRREKNGSPDSRPRTALREIVAHLQEIMNTECPNGTP